MPCCLKQNDSKDVSCATTHLPTILVISNRLGQVVLITTGMSSQCVEFVMPNGTVEGCPFSEATVNFLASWNCMDGNL